jgi:hypothetical protein
MVIVVGTRHTIQIADLELKRFLENLCREFNVRAVTEEMSDEALAEKDCTASIPMQVASAMQIPHRLCDPNRDACSPPVRESDLIAARTVTEACGVSWANLYMNVYTV